MKIHALLIFSIVRGAIKNASKSSDASIEIAASTTQKPTRTIDEILPSWTNSPTKGQSEPTETGKRPSQTNDAQPLSFPVDKPSSTVQSMGKPTHFKDVEGDLKVASSVFSKPTVPIIDFEPTSVESIVPTNSIQISSSRWESSLRASSTLESRPTPTLDSSQPVSDVQKPVSVGNSQKNDKEPNPTVSDKEPTIVAPVIIAPLPPNHEKVPVIPRKPEESPSVKVSEPTIIPLPVIVPGPTLPPRDDPATFPSRNDPIGPDSPLNPAPAIVPEQPQVNEKSNAQQRPPAPIIAETQRGSRPAQPAMQPQAPANEGRQEDIPKSDVQIVMSSHSPANLPIPNTKSNGDAIAPVIQNTANSNQKGISAFLQADEQQLEAKVIENPSKSPDISAPAPAPVDVSSIDSQESTTSNVSLPVILSITGGVLVLAIAGFLVFQRKKAQQNEPNLPPPVSFSAPGTPSMARSQKFESGLSFVTDSEVAPFEFPGLSRETSISTPMMMDRRTSVVSNQSVGNERSGLLAHRYSHQLFSEDVISETSSLSRPSVPHTDMSQNLASAALRMATDDSLKHVSVVTDLHFGTDFGPRDSQYTTGTFEFSEISELSPYLPNAMVNEGEFSYGSIQMIHRNRDTMKAQDSFSLIHQL